MGKTIIQSIGPLYGDVVNGTVFGRPNGSIYVPAVNTVSIAIGASYVAVGLSPAPYAGWVIPAKSDGTVIVSPPSIKCVAESQDTSAYIAVQFSGDEDFDTYEESIVTAGNFNVTRTSIIDRVSAITITAGTPYYVRAVLYAQSGVPVAYSDVITLTGAVVE